MTKKQILVGIGVGCGCLAFLTVGGVVTALIVLPMMNTALSDARVSHLASSVNSLKDAVTGYNGDTARFPREDLDFIRRPDRKLVENWKGPYLDSFPENPFKNDGISDWRLTPSAIAQKGIALPGEEAYGWTWYMDGITPAVYDRIEDQLNEGEGKLGNGPSKGLIHSSSEAKTDIYLIVAYPTDDKGDPL